MSETAKNTPEDLHDVNAEETASEEVAAEATEEELEDAALQDPVEALEDVPLAGWFGRTWDSLQLWIKNL